MSRSCKNNKCSICKIALGCWKSKNKELIFNSMPIAEGKYLLKCNLGWRHPRPKLPKREGNSYFLLGKRFVKPAPYFVLFAALSDLVHPSGLFSVTAQHISLCCHTAFFSPPNRSAIGPVHHWGEALLHHGSDSVWGARVHRRGSCAELQGSLENSGPGHLDTVATRDPGWWEGILGLPVILFIKSSREPVFKR